MINVINSRMKAFESKETDPVEVKDNLSKLNTASSHQLTSQQNMDSSRFNASNEFNKHLGQGSKD